MSYRVLSIEGEKAFVSRRNDVRRARLQRENGEELACLCKIYGRQQALQWEQRLLGALAKAGLLVPEVLLAQRDRLFISLLPGQNYTQLLEDLERENPLDEERPQKALVALLSWLKDYRKATGGLLRGDVNLRNFLYYEGTCAGLDFEEAMEDGPIETDLGKIKAFMLAYEPAFSPYKQRLGAIWDKLCAESGADKEAIRQAYLRELAAIEGRRGQTMPDFAREL